MGNELQEAIAYVIYARITVMAIITLGGILLFSLGFYLIVKNYIGSFRLETRVGGLEANSPGLAFLAAGGFLMWLAAETELDYSRIPPPAPPPAAEAPEVAIADEQDRDAQGNDQAPTIATGVRKPEPAPRQRPSGTPPQAREKAPRPTRAAASELGFTIRFSDGPPLTADRVNQALRIGAAELDRLAQQGDAEPEDASRYRVAASVLNRLSADAVAGRTGDAE